MRAIIGLLLAVLCGPALAQSATSPPLTIILPPSGGGGTGCVPAGGSAATNLVLYGPAGACVPDTNANATAGALTLGASGTVGSLILGNATSGLVTVNTVAGALGTVTASLPANSGIIAELDYAQTWSAAQTFANGDLLLAGSSSGAGTLEAPAAASTYVWTLPAATASLGYKVSSWTSGNCLQASGTAGGIADSGSANCGGSSGANPSATAGPSANNGSAGTFMRSDASPAVQKGSNAQFGITEGDSTSITCTAGVCSATGEATLAGNNVFTGLNSGSGVAITISSTTYTPSGAVNSYTIALTSACASAACTLANMSATPPANTSGVIRITQPASGGPASFGNYGSIYKAPGGVASITLSTAANAVDFFSYTSDGTYVYLVPILNFSH